MLFKGPNLVRELASALGLPESGWQRIVIVAETDAVPRVYVKGLLSTDGAARIVEAVAQLEVSDDGDVSLVRFAEEITEAE